MASALTRAAWRQALPRVSMRDCPPGFSLNQGGVEAGSAQGLYETPPSWAGMLRPMGRREHTVQQPHEGLQGADL